MSECPLPIWFSLEAEGVRRDVLRRKQNSNEVVNTANTLQGDNRRRNNWNVPRGTI